MSTDKKLGKLMDIEYNHPSPDDKDFLNKVYQKREFYYHKIPARPPLNKYDDIKQFRDKQCSRKFALFEHQAFLRNFINPDTPYHGVLVFHGTGTGKTSGGIAIAEQFKGMVQKYGTKIHVLVSGPLIRENWKDEIISSTGETYITKDESGKLISTAEKYKRKRTAINNAMQYYKFMSYRSFYKKVLGEKIVERVKIGDDKVKVTYRKTKEGEFERDISIDRIYNLDNSLIIIDEAHNLTGNAYGEALMKIAKASTNLKIVLLTATPMKNLADDIIELINFIRPPDSPLQRDKIFTSEKNHTMDLKPTGLDYLKKMTRGYISYLRGADPMTFAKRVEKGTIPKGLRFTRVTSCKMKPFQRIIYDEAIREEEDALDRKSEAVANFAFPGLSQDRKKIIGFYGNSGLNIIKNQIKTNGDELNRKIITDILKLDEADIEGDMIYLSEGGKSISGNILKMRYLKNFSIKFYKALKKLNRLVWPKKGAKTAFVYSNLVKVGIELFTEVLLQNGYLEYNEDKSNYKFKPDTRCYYCGASYKEHQHMKLKETLQMSRVKDISDSSTEYKEKKEEPPTHEFNPAVFLTITGKSTDDTTDIIPEDKKRILDDVFNAVDNREGKFIKFILGSRVMNEGISLMNTSEVHVLDVYFNLGRVDQVVGRAIRNCSHYAIINDKNRFPEVSVYKYSVTLGKELSSEEELYRKAELKYMLIKKVERALKEIAIDCPINRHGNIFPEEIEKYKKCIRPGKLKTTDDNNKKNICPAMCDYTECDFKCDNVLLNKLHWDEKSKSYRKIQKVNLDHTTFTQQLARGEIDHVKKVIKEVYKINYVYTLNQILDYIKNSYRGEKMELFDEFFAFRALDELIPITENDFNNFKDTIYDKYNNPGYLIYVNKYYIFQPFDQNEDVPMYYRSTYDKNLNTKLSLFNYLSNTNKLEKIETQQEKKVSEGVIGKYDFDSVLDYYDNREEYEIVGIIDKESSRRKTKTLEELADVFKIREKRARVLEKKRGTGIPSLKGAVCFSSKSKEYLEDVAKKLKIKLKGDETRTEICDQIKEALLRLEKYSTAKQKNKITYIMIPRNHPKYTFPYNLEDRTKFIVEEIRDLIKFNIKMDIKKLKHKKNLHKYQITIKDTSKLKDFANKLKKLGFGLSKGKWILNIE